MPCEAHGVTAPRATLGQRYLAPDTVEQADTEQLFELGDALADRGLRQMQPLCGL